jgi:hypothetical protein
MALEKEFERIFIFVECWYVIKVNLVFVNNIIIKSY